MAAALLLSTVIGSSAVFAPRFALAHTSSEKSFSVPAGSLNQALVAFGRQAGVQVTYNPSIAADKRSGGARGNLAPDQALAQILQGSGLNYSFPNANTVAISDGATGAESISADGSILLETIHIQGAGGTFSPDTPYETPGSSVYISGADLERRGWTNPGDIFKDTPGVLNGDNRNSGALDVNIRGMQGQGRVPVIVDGTRQESSVYRGYSGVAGRTYVDPDMISSVVIDKGPSAAGDATGAIGGVVRMETLNVNDVLLPGKSYGFRLKGGFNTNSAAPPERGTVGGYYGAGTYTPTNLPDSFADPDGMNRPGFLSPTGGNGSVAFAASSEHFDFVAAYSRRKNGNYFAGTTGGNDPFPLITELSTTHPDVPPNYRVEFDGLNRFRAGEEVLNTSVDNESYLAKGALKFGNGHEFELGYMRFDSRFGEMMPSMILRGDGAFQGESSHVEVDTYTAKYSWNPSDNDLVDLTARLWMKNLNSNQNLSEYSFGQFYWNYIPEELRSIGASVENNSHLDTRFGPLKLSYGVHYLHEDAGTPSGVIVSGSLEGYRRDGWRREASAFAHAEWKPVDWLRFDGGLRYSDYRTQDRREPLLSRKIIYYYDEGGAEIRWEGTTREYRDSGRGGTYLRYEIEEEYGPPAAGRGDGWSPSASVTVEPMAGVQFYGKWVNAMRSPSLFESTMGSSTNVNSVAMVGPERSHNWEAGVNILRDEVFIPGDSLRFNANYFHADTSNYISRLTDADGAFLTTNIDKAKFHGMDVSLKYDTGSYFGSVGWTHYLDMKFCAMPGQLPDTYTSLCYSGGLPNSFAINHIPPQDSLTLTLGARLFEGKLTLGGTMTYNSGRPVSGLGAGAGNSGTGFIPSVEWKSYATYDFFASYKLNEKFQFNAAVDNVTDVYYMDPLTLGLMPSPGRAFRLNMTANF